MGRLDPLIESLVREYKLCWLAGGAVRQLFISYEKLSDYDLFFSNREAVESTRTILLNNKFKEVFACPKGMLYTYKWSDRDDTIVVQLICEHMYSSASDVIEEFDIIPGCAILDHDGSVICHPGFLNSIDNYVLNFHKITYPVSSLKRIAKYACKGYFMRGDAAQYFVLQSRMLDDSLETMRIYID